MNWSHIQEMYGEELRNGTGKMVFDTISDDGNKTWEELRKRVVEHVRFEIKLFSKSSTIHTIRLS